MKDFKVYSKIKDKKIHKDVDKSKIWKECLTESEFNELEEVEKQEYLIYTIRFDGLKPVQVLKTDKYEKNQKSNT
jgi:hypothetical protein